jgi:hypothetical protein
LESTWKCLVGIGWICVTPCNKNCVVPNCGLPPNCGTGLVTRGPGLTVVWLTIFLTFTIDVAGWL